MHQQSRVSALRCKHLGEAVCRSACRYSLSSLSAAFGVRIHACVSTTMSATLRMLRMRGLATSSLRATLHDAPILRSLSRPPSSRCQSSSSAPPPEPSLSDHLNGKELPRITGLDWAVSVVQGVAAFTFLYYVFQCVPFCLIRDRELVNAYGLLWLMHGSLIT